MDPRGGVRIAKFQRQLVPKSVQSPKINACITLDNPEEIIEFSDSESESDDDEENNVQDFLEELQRESEEIIGEIENCRKIVEPDRIAGAIGIGIPANKKPLIIGGIIRNSNEIKNPSLEERMETEEHLQTI